AAELALAAAAVLAAEQDDTDPWSIRDGWRTAKPLQRRLAFADSSGAREVVLTYVDGGCLAQPDATQGEAPAVFLPRHRSGHADATSPQRLQLQVEGRRAQAQAVFEDETLHLFAAEGHLRLGYIDRIAHAGEAAEEGGRLTAPMPGKVISVLVDAGSVVSKGQPLLVMEAMKMEHTITAPADGVIEQIHYG